MKPGHVQGTNIAIVAAGYNDFDQELLLRRIAETVLDTTVACDLPFMGTRVMRDGYLDNECYAAVLVVVLPGCRREELRPVALSDEVPTLYLMARGAPAPVVFPRLCLTVELFGTDDEAVDATSRFVAANERLLRFPVQARGVTPPVDRRKASRIVEAAASTLQIAWAFKDDASQRDIAFLTGKSQDEIDALFKSPNTLGDTDSASGLLLVASVLPSVITAVEGIDQVALSTSQLSSLMTAAEELGWNTGRALENANAAVRELAKDGTKRLRFSTTTDWQLLDEREHGS